MNKLRNKIIYILAAFLFSTNPTQNAAAQSSPDGNICTNTDIVFAFFNGVQTTPEGADDAKEELRRIHGDQSSKGETIKYEVLYNYSNGFEDFVETFEQRLQEQNGILEGRFELFFEAITGNGPWWSKVIDSVQSTAGILKGFVDWHAQTGKYSVSLDQ